MVIQVVNFNLVGINHEDYLGTDKVGAPTFKEPSCLRSKI